MFDENSHEGDNEGLRGPGTSRTGQITRGEIVDVPKSRFESIRNDLMVISRECAGHEVRLGPSTERPPLIGFSAAD